MYVSEAFVCLVIYDDTTVTIDITNNIFKVQQKLLSYPFLFLWSGLFFCFHFKSSHYTRADYRSHNRGSFQSGGYLTKL